MWSSFQSKSKKSIEKIVDSDTSNHSRGNSDSSTPTSTTNEKNQTTKKYDSNNMESHEESNSTIINEDVIIQNNISAADKEEDKLENETKKFNTFFQMDENQIMDETNLDEFNHNENHSENESLRLYDEISISTKDSLGPTAFIEPIFDLQAPTKTAKAETQMSKHPTKTFHDFKSIGDSECIQMYHDQDDSKEINVYRQKEDGDDVYDKDNTNITVQFGSHDEKHIIENDQQDEKITQTCEKLDIEEEDVKRCHEREETVSSSSSPSKASSYDSFQRIVKRAFLRSKVEHKRQNLSSKISILNTKSVDATVDCNSHDHDDTNQFVEDEVKSQCNDTSITDTNRANEDVFLGLGKLMYKEDDDQGQHHQQQQQHQPSAESGDDPNVTREANPFSSWNQISTKTLLYIIIVMSVVMNVCNYLPFFDITGKSDNEMDGQDTNTLTKDAMNFFLVYSKLSMVQDEMKALHLEKKESDFMSSLKLGFVVLVIFTSFVVSLFVVNKKNAFVPNECNNPCDFISPSTNKKSLRRELSSLDKKNIFPSTMNTETVQKDGTIKEVKRSMRFSPEAKRFTSPPLKQVSCASSNTTTRQLPKKTYVNGMKSPGMFSPRLKKMKPVKEEH